MPEERTNEPVRYWTEAECCAQFWLGATLTVNGFLVAVCVYLLMHEAKLFGGFLGLSFLKLAATRDDYQLWKRVQKGERIPLPVEPGQKPVSRRKKDVQTVAIVLLLTACYIVLLANCLHALLHPSPLAQTVAAVYLLTASSLAYGFLWKNIRQSLRKRRMSAHLPMTSAAASSAAVERSLTPVPKAVMARRHWRTNTDTREEIQQTQKSGR